MSGQPARRGRNEPSGGIVAGSDMIWALTLYDIHSMLDIVESFFSVTKTCSYGIFFRVCFL